MTTPELSAKKKQENIVEWLGTLSSSLQWTYFHTPIEKMRSFLQEAHKIARDWAELM